MIDEVPKICLDCKRNYCSLQYKKGCEGKYFQPLTIEEKKERAKYHYVTPDLTIDEKDIIPLPEIDDKNEE